MRGARTILGATMLIALGAATAPPSPKPTPAPPLLAVRALQPGLWQLLVTDSGHTIPREICLGDTRQLLQLRHGAAPCGSFVIANDAKVATVQYSCPGAGWGRTSLRPENPTALHIESQGIADNAPFALTAEGKRIADCPAPAAAAAVAPGALPAPAPSAAR